MADVLTVHLFATTDGGGQSDIEEITDALTASGLSIWDYAAAALVFVVASALGWVVALAVRRLVDRSRADNFLGDLIGRIANYLIVIFGFIYAIETLGIAIGPILGALGIVGIALAFAFQDILENFVAGIILQLQRPFTSGDEIETAGHEGAIIAVDTRTITIRSPDGETVRIPSAAVIKNPIINHTQHGRRRTTLTVGVAYDTDLDHATRTVLDALRSIEQIYQSPAPEVLVLQFGDSSIDLAVRYWHEPSITALWRSRDIVAKAVVSAFRSNHITVPFPQRVLHVPRPVDVQRVNGHGPEVNSAGVNSADPRTRQVDDLDPERS